MTWAVVAGFLLEHWEALAGLFGAAAAFLAGGARQKRKQRVRELETHVEDLEEREDVERDLRSASDDELRRRAGRWGR